MNAVLALEDGTWYRGVAAGASGEARGEVVFNTSMTGYQEVLTDPSYAGQIVTMTAPQIGNYGVAAGDAESQAPRVAGFVMREASPIASNWRADGTLRDYLVRHNIVAIADIDTRALTRVLRSAGVMRGVIATGQVDPAELVEKARAIPRMEGADLVQDVTCDSAVRVARARAGVGRRRSPRVRHRAGAPGDARGCASPPTTSASSGTSCAGSTPTAATCTCFRPTAPAAELLAIEPDGIFLSNGPGDPAALPYAIDNVRELVDARACRCSASVSATRFSASRSAARRSS